MLLLLPFIGLRRHARLIDGLAAVFLTLTLGRHDKLPRFTSTVKFKLRRKFPSDAAKQLDATCNSPTGNKEWRSCLNYVAMRTQPVRHTRGFASVLLTINDLNTQKTRLRSVTSAVARTVKACWPPAARWKKPRDTTFNARV